MRMCFSLSVSSRDNIGMYVLWWGERKWFYSLTSLSCLLLREFSSLLETLGKTWILQYQVKWETKTQYNALHARVLQVNECLRELKKRGLKLEEKLLKELLSLCFCDIFFKRINSGCPCFCFQQSSLDNFISSHTVVFLPLRTKTAFNFSRVSFNKGRLLLNAKGKNRREKKYQHGDER